MTATFVGLSDGRAGDGGTRVNAGVYNPSTTALFAGFTVHAESGETLNTVYQMVGPGAWTQVNDLFSQAGAGSARPGSFVTFTSGAPVFPFLISIDNRSGDSVYLEPRESFQP